MSNFKDLLVYKLSGSLMIKIISLIDSCFPGCCRMQKIQTKAVIPAVV